MRKTKTANEKKPAEVTKPKRKFTKSSKKKSSDGSLSPFAQMVIDAYNTKHADVSDSAQKADGQTSADQQYDVTPNNIMYSLLRDIYKIDPDVDKFNHFMALFMKFLSLLSTQGAEPCVYGYDLNTLFETFVTTLNICNAMKRLLDQHNIDFDIEKTIADLRREIEDKLH